jgi:hypothetical protein
MHKAGSAPLASAAASVRLVCRLSRERAALRGFAHTAPQLTIKGSHFCTVRFVSPPPPPRLFPFHKECPSLFRYIIVAFVDIVTHDGHSSSGVNAKLQPWQGFTCSHTL